MKKHPDKHIDVAVKYAESRGWKVSKPGKSGHPWGRLKCPFNDSECRDGQFCLQSIASTPRNAQNHAKQIRRIVDNCIRMSNSDEEE